MKLKTVAERNTKLYQTKTLPSITVYFLNRRITFMTIEAIIEAIHSACLEKSKLIIASYNVNSFNLSMQIPWFYRFQQNADIARCDGTGIIKGLQLMGIDLPLEYRVSGTELVPKLLNYSNRYGFSIFLLGSKPQHLEQALSRQRVSNPNLSFAGHHGYFDKEDPTQNEAIIEEINRFKPDILIVGMGMPAQEKWIQQHHSQLETSVILPCGAVIDRLAGLVTNCPAWVSDNGLEWLYRLVGEPKRLAARYLLGNPLFLLNVGLAKLQGFSPLCVTEIQSRNSFELNINERAVGLK